MHSEVSNSLSVTNVELKKYKDELSRKEQDLFTKEQEVIELKQKLETLEMSKIQLDETIERYH